MMFYIGIAFNVFSAVLKKTENIFYLMFLRKYVTSHPKCLIYACCTCGMYRTVLRKKEFNTHKAKYEASRNHIKVK